MTSVPWKGKNETGSKVKSVVKTVNQIEKENISPRLEKVVEILSPLREPSPFDLEFEDMLNTQMISVEEGELFNGIRKVKEDVTDANKLDDSVGVVTAL
jgi:predicted transcriptional regulator